MCRFFLFYSNGTNFAPDVVSTVDPVLQSWKQATSNDKYLYELVKINQHDDGWGSFNYYLCEQGKEHFSVQKSSEPAFKEDHSLTVNKKMTSNFILLNHARKASPKMPITLNQNHPFVNEQGTSILAHNGTLDKNILSEFLNNCQALDMDNLSDTQVLNVILKEKFGEITTTDYKILFQAWKELIEQIKTKHKEKGINYSMNLIFLLKNSQTNNFYMFYTTAYSNSASKNYLDFYCGVSNNNIVLSSSTIIDKYMKDFPDQYKQWNFQVLPNNTVGVVNLQDLGKIEGMI